MFRKRFPLALMLCAVIGTGIDRPAVAATTAPVPTTGAAPTSLPACRNAESDIAAVKNIQQANRKTSRKYDGYRNILPAIAGVELAARLAYAETLAANCPEQEDHVVDLITSVIGNRVRIRPGNISSVVLQKDQFASSLNIYADSRYRDFLCPRDGELWNKVLTKMRENLAASQPTAPIPQDTVNYYLYQHSDRFKPPAWELEEASINDPKTRECIRVFRDPRWK